MINTWRSASVERAVKRQWFTRAAKEVTGLEKDILRMIDIVFAKSGRRVTPHCSDPVIFGLCVRRMSLHYRRQCLKGCELFGKGTPVDPILLLRY